MGFGSVAYRMSQTDDSLERRQAVSLNDVFAKPQRELAEQPDVALERRVVA